MYLYNNIIINMLYVMQLAPIQLKRYSEDLLFFLYYSNGGELLQLLATIELWVCYLVNASVTSSDVALRLQAGV